MIPMTKDEWNAEGERRFGTDRMKWKFVCPICKHVASVEDWQRIGAKEGEVAFSCIGRHINGAQQAFLKTKKGPCYYAGGGLFHLNPVLIDGKHEMFEFGPATIAAIPANRAGEVDEPTPEANH